jgi:RNA polymerase sigma factor (sigma-70 family)
VPPADTHRAIDAVWRIESARVIAGLTRLVRDVGLAEDLAQDALVAALEQWPASGIPHNPGAWLMATAKHRAIDRLRRNSLLERKHEELGREVAARELTVPDLAAALDDPVGDDLLRLVFICCHPVLTAEARVALTLRLLGGLTTTEIARAFLVPEATVAQRIVRAKRTLADAHVPFEVPRGHDLAARLSSVLEVVYLIFNEGYSATAGDDWMRPALCDDALRLGRILAELAPNEPEVHGLVALMEIQASRSRARVGPSGEPILLFDQNRAHWDQLLIHRGLAALERAERLARADPQSSDEKESRGKRNRSERPRGLVQPESATPSTAAEEPAGWPVQAPLGRRFSAPEVSLGPYALQAAIAACHARARTPEETDWPRIVALYETLARRTPSPVVELNRAVAVGMAFGPAAGLELVDALAAEPSLQNYHLLPTVRGDLLRKLGRFAEAGAEFDRAATLARNARERALLKERAENCARESAAS